MDTLARAPGGQMRGAATKAMSDIVEERQQSRYALFGAAPLRAAARRPAGFVARSSRTAPGIARRSRLASGAGGEQQNVNLFLREPLMVRKLSQGLTAKTRSARRKRQDPRCDVLLAHRSNRNLVRVNRGPLGPFPGSPGAQRTGHSFAEEL